MFKVIFELPLLVLSFGAGGFFPPFCEAEVPANFGTSFVPCSSLEGFSLPLTAEVRIEDGLHSSVVKNFAAFLSLEQKHASTKMA